MTNSLIKFQVLIFLRLQLNQPSNQVIYQLTQKILKILLDLCLAQVPLEWNQNFVVVHCFRWRELWKRETIT
jgi:hypothetical protein